MKIRDFGVEIWMNRHENDCRFNLAETCVESLSVAELLTIAGKSNSLLDELLPMKLTYGAIEGSERLRDAIASMYERQGRENVVATHGAIGANALVYQALVEPGDRVVSMLPTYQQHYSIPESLGGAVRPLWLRAENGYLPDLDELRGLAGDRGRCHGGAVRGSADGGAARRHRGKHREAPSAGAGSRRTCRAPTAT